MKSFFLVKEGEVSDATAETEFDAIESVLVYAEDEAQARDLAQKYDDGIFSYGNVTVDGKTVSAVTWIESDDYPNYIEPHLNYMNHGTRSVDGEHLRNGSRGHQALEQCGGCRDVYKVRMNRVNLYIKPETLEHLDKIAEHYALPSKSAAVAFLAKQEARRIGKKEKSDKEGE